MKPSPRWLKLSLFWLTIAFFALMLFSWVFRSYIEGETADDRLAEEIPRFPLAGSDWTDWFVSSGSTLDGTDLYSDIDVGYYDESHDAFFNFYNQELPKLGWVSAGPVKIESKYVVQEFTRKFRGKSWLLTLSRSRGITSARDGEVWLTSIDIEPGH